MKKEKKEKRANEEQNKLLQVFTISGFSYLSKYLRHV